MRFVFAALAISSCATSSSTTRELPVGLSSLGALLDGCQSDAGDDGVMRMRCGGDVVLAVKPRTSGEPQYKSEAYGIAQNAGARLVWDQVVVPTESESGLVDRARALEPGSDLVKGTLVGIVRQLPNGTSQEVWCSSDDDAGVERCKALVGAVLGARETPAATASSNSGAAPADVSRAGADSTGATATSTPGATPGTTSLGAATSTPGAATSTPGAAASTPGVAATSTPGAGAQAATAPASGSRPQASGPTTVYGRSLSLPTSCTVQPRDDGGGDAKCKDGASLTWHKFSDMDEAAQTVNATLAALGDEDDGDGFACIIVGEVGRCESHAHSLAGLTYLDGKALAVLCVGVSDPVHHSLCRALMRPQ